MCGYKRKVLESLPAKPLQVDLPQIDARLNLLTCASLSTSYEKQKQSLKEELESFLRSLPGKNHFCLLHLATFAGSLFGKIKKAKHRDQAFLKILFFSGDRGSDLGNDKTPEILRFPSDDGFLFNHIWGKTLRDGTFNVFGIRRHPNSAICPVTAIETYVAICAKLAIDLSKGYLFRPTNPQGDVVGKPLSGSTAQQRLELYLKEAHLDEGETLHSLRSGCAITLALSGAQLADVMSHVGWKNGQTALYYMKLGEVLRLGSSSHLLSSTSEEASSLFNQYASLDSLKNFICAFPSRPTGEKRPSSDSSSI
ncbi:hypothetical protein ACROYT_G037338 [Oculina patagonica]